MIGDLGIESEEQRQVHVGYELKARMMQCLGHVYPQCTSVVWVVVKLFCFVLLNLGTKGTQSLLFQQRWWWCSLNHRCKWEVLS